MESETSSKDLTFEWGRTAPYELSKLADSMDTKIMGAFATGSLIIGVTSIRLQALVFDWTASLLVIAAIAYLVILVASLWALLPMTFAVADDPRKIKEFYWHLPKDEVQTKYWEYIEKATDRARSNVEFKSRCFTIVVGGLAVEVPFLITWLVVLAVWC